MKKTDSRVKVGKRAPVAVPSAITTIHHAHPLPFTLLFEWDTTSSVELTKTDQIQNLWYLNAPVRFVFCFIYTK